MFKNLKQHIFRSPYQSLAAVLVISFSLFLISVFFLLGAGSEEILRYFESRPQLIAYLKDEAKPQEIELLKAKIESTGKAKKIDYVSKEDALKTYRHLFKDKPLLLEMVTAKILPASLEISPTNLSGIKEMADILKKEFIVEDIDFEEDVISTLSRFITNLRLVGIIVAGILLLISVLTVLVIIGMKISQQKEEIEILKLLGASSWYIYLPLYFEGIIFGWLAAGISWGLTYGLILYTTPFLVNFFSGIPIFPVSVFSMMEVLGGLFGLGTIVGFLGSFLAVIRFSRSVR